MKRKLLCALLCAAMTATMLAGCGDKKDDNAADTNQEASNDNSASERVHPVTTMQQMKVKKQAIQRVPLLRAATS